MDQQIIDIFNEIQSDIESARANIKTLYKDDSSSLYNLGYADGILKGLKEARMLFWKYYPDADEIQKKHNVVSK